MFIRLHINIIIILQFIYKTLYVSIFINNIIRIPSIRYHSYYDFVDIVDLTIDRPLQFVCHIRVVARKI